MFTLGEVYLTELLSLEMKLGTRVQILDEAVCISLCVNTLGKVWIHLFFTQLWVGQSEFFNLG